MGRSAISYVRGFCQQILCYDVIRRFAFLTVLSGFLFYTYTVFHGKSPLQLSANKLIFPRKHIVLYDGDIKNREVFIIGDIHGCLDELRELLELARKEVKEKDILPIFVGDLATKGPHGIMTIREMRKMDAFSVKGNDDDNIIKHYIQYKKNPNYIFPKDLQWIKDLNDYDINFLQDLPYTIWIPSKSSYIVHAGIIPNIPFDQHNVSDFMTLRNLKIVNGKYLPVKYPQGEAWASLWPSHEYVYFGHDAARGFQKYQFTTGLDTGCVYGLNLTGILLNSKKILQIRAKKAYIDPAFIDVI